MTIKDNSYYFTRYEDMKCYKKPPYHTLLAQLVTTDQVLATCTRESDTNPNWRDLIAQGKSATTDMVAEMYGVKQQQSVVTWTHPTGNYQFDICTKPLFEPSLEVDSDLLGKANAESQQKLWHHFEAEFKSLEVLGELRETVRFLKNPCYLLRTRFGGYISSMSKSREAFWKKGRRSAGLSFNQKGLPANKLTWRTQREWARIVSDSWLEFSFGLRPLLGDIEDAGSAFRKAINRPKSVKFGFRGIARSNVETTMYRGGYGWNYSAYDCWHKHWKTATSQYIGAARPSFETDAYMGQFGLFPLEFVPALYELAPWSFILDYFGNIGSVLAAWATSNRVKFDWVQHTTRNFAYSHAWMEPNVRVYNVSGSSSTVERYKKVMSRTKLVEVPVPDIALKWKFNAHKALNIASLLALAEWDMAWRPIFHK